MHFEELHSVIDAVGSRAGNHFRSCCVDIYNIYIYLAV